MEIGDFSVSYRFKNVEDGFCKVFTCMYGLLLGGLGKSSRRSWELSRVCGKICGA